jgi:hypothetical protein
MLESEEPVGFFRHLAQISASEGDFKLQFVYNKH